MLHRTELHPLLSAYLDGEIPLYELRAHFYSKRLKLEDNSEEGLYQAVSMHLAMYTAGTWPESELKDAIRWHVTKSAGEDVPPGIPMMDEQWISIMRSGNLPWPIKCETRHAT